MILIFDTCKLIKPDLAINLHVCSLLHCLTFGVITIKKTPNCIVEHVTNTLESQKACL